ncbi:UbiX family flavin prenyltransferase [Planctomicrobium sp. SH668]|uniref:UbiX family flavin prenyltransferase n=1 Tax=Planctomicrobium sp. SH668 TaxID=3448126 RepID=UPI003F5C4383
MHPYVLAITGASGAAYSIRLLEVLLSAGHSVELTISPSATIVLKAELGLTVDVNAFDLQQLLPNLVPGAVSGKFRYHHFQNFHAGIASGSFLTSGMVICPCSMGTLASIANGLSTNLIHRAADVHLKERRKLIVVPRETPLGSIQLQNMKTLADAGGVILPAMPGFYHQPKSISDLIDFVVARICDHLGVQRDLSPRWGTSSDSV